MYIHMYIHTHIYTYLYAKSSKLGAADSRLPGCPAIDTNTNDNNTNNNNHDTNKHKK